MEFLIQVKLLEMAFSNWNISRCLKDSMGIMVLFIYPYVIEKPYKKNWWRTWGLCRFLASKIDQNQLFRSFEPWPIVKPEVFHGFSRYFQQFSEYSTRIIKKIHGIVLANSDISFQGSIYANLPLISRNRLYLWKVIIPKIIEIW